MLVNKNSKKTPRLFTLAFFIGIFLVAFTVGSEVQIEKTEANQITNMMGEKMKTVVDNSVGAGIFLNNAKIALLMFTPALGIIIGISTAFTTGMVVSAIGSVHELAFPAITLLLFSPFGIMELFAYGIAMSRSFLILLALIRKQSLKPQLKMIGIEIGMVVGLLFFGGIIENFIINSRV